MRRRAFTLIEVLVSIGIGTTAMAGVVVVLGIVLETDRLSREQTHTAAVLGRLAAAFRGDVHQAKSVTPSKGKANSLAVILADDSNVEYRAVPEGVARHEKASGKADRSELFMLPKDATTEFESNAQANSATARMRISSADRMGIHVSIEALAGAELKSEATR